jgi:prepilin-type N-terminal cleavage/methylation domain-containing protein
LKRHPPTPPTAARKNGFTLVELLVTIFVAAILTAIAAPSFLHTIRSNRADTLANQLIATLAMARSEAVKLGATVTVLSVSGGNDWGSGGWCVSAPPSGTAPSCGTTGQPYIVQMAAPVTTSGNPATVNGTVSQLAFDSTGHLQLISGAKEVDFIVCADGSTATKPLGVGVNVISFGRTRMADFNSAGLPLHNDGVTAAQNCTTP